MTRIRSAAIAALLAAATATVAVAEDKATLYGSIIDAAMQETRVFLTCTVLDHQSHEFIRKNWQESVAETLAFLDSEGVRPPNLAAFRESALPGGLVPPPDTPLSDVIAFCDANPDWIRKFQRLDVIRLPQALEEATDP